MGEAVAVHRRDLVPHVEHEGPVERLGRLGQGDDGVLGCVVAPTPGARPPPRSGALDALLEQADRALRRRDDAPHRGDSCPASAAVRRASASCSIRRWTVS